jgi:hypothetical protein
MMGGEEFSHELMLNPSLRLDAEEEMMDSDRRVCLRVRDILDNAFWDVLRAKIENLDCFVCVTSTIANILGEVRRRLSQFRGSLLKQEFIDSICGGSTSGEILDFVGRMHLSYENTCIPGMKRLFNALETVRESVVAQDERGQDRIEFTRHEAMECIIGMEHAIVANEQKAFAFCRALRILLKRSRQLRMDWINGKMYSVARYMEQHGIQMESDAVDSQIVQGTADVESCMRWLEYTIVNNFRGGVVEPNDDDVARGTAVNNFRGGVVTNDDYEAIVHVAWVNAVTDKESVDLLEKPGFLLQFDRRRLLTMRKKFDSWVRIASVVHAVQAIVTSSSSTTATTTTMVHQEVVDEVADALFFYVEEDRGGLFNEEEELVQIALGTMMRRIKKSVINNNNLEQQMLSVALSKESGVRSVLRGYLLQSLGTGDSCCSNLDGSKFVAGRNQFVREMQQHIDVLIDMVTISKMAHMEKYRQMIASFR